MTEETDAVAARLMRRHGRTFAEELGIDLPGGGRDALFQWLVTALLCSARIAAPLALRGVKGLLSEGLGTLESMEAAGWDGRRRVLNAHGYARYDERTATMLGEACAMIRARWGGDLRALREAAGRDPARERRLIKDFKGIGDVGADIFAREAQDPWPELRPFADAIALEAARGLGLPTDAPALAALVPERDFTRLVAALARARLERDVEAIRTGAD